MKCVPNLRLFTFALSAAQTYFTGWVGERGLADLRIRLFAHLQRLSLGYYERNRTGVIVSRVRSPAFARDRSFGPRRPPGRKEDAP